MSKYRSTFDELGEFVEFEKGDSIFRQGDENKFLYYIRTGLLKAYYITDSGKEFVKSFLKEGDVIGSLTALMSDGRCTFSLTCLEPSTLGRVPFGELLQLAHDDLTAANEIIRLLSNLAIKKERREYELLCLTAEDRFEILKGTTPDLLERVTQNDIALYLGITPVALSRIRSRTKV